MTARQFLFSLLAASLICSLSPAAPPDGKAVGKPVLVPVWKETTIGLPKEETVEPEPSVPGREWVAKFYQSVMKDCRDSKRYQIPPATPQVTDGLVIYANDEGMVARPLSDSRGLEFKLA